MTTSLLLLFFVFGLFWLGYRNPRRRRWLLRRRVVTRAAFSAVDRQHRHLVAGGQLSKSTVATTANRYRELLDSGRSNEVLRELTPGVDFAIKVQALAEVGTQEAVGLLARQLDQRLSRDPVEQAWYWADVASALRQLGHQHALPAILHCADEASSLPAGRVLAAQAVAFPNFSATVREYPGALGRAGLRAVTRVIQGCRDGAIDLVTLLQAGVGDLLEHLSTSAPQLPDPWLTEALLEGERLQRRLGTWSKTLPAEARMLAEKQLLHLTQSTAARQGWLVGAPARLIAAVPWASTLEKSASIHCLAEFRSDVSWLFPTPPPSRDVWSCAAIGCLRWSRNTHLGPELADAAASALRSRRQVDRAVALLTALRGHRCTRAEQILLIAIKSRRALIRAAAASSLGWWLHFEAQQVVDALQGLQSDPTSAVRRTASGALARLGNRAAIREFQAGLLSEESGIRIATANRIVVEEISWLWPDLEALADSPEADIAFAAIEALARLRENILGPLA